MHVGQAMHVRAAMWSHRFWECGACCALPQTVPYVLISCLKTWRLYSIQDCSTPHVQILVSGIGMYRSRYYAYRNRYRNENRGVCAFVYLYMHMYL